MKERKVMSDKCTVKVGEEKKEANLYGFFQHSHVHTAMLIGDTSGVIAYPVAVVDWGEGLREVHLSFVSEVKTSMEAKLADHSLDAIRYAMDSKNLGQSIIGKSIWENERGGQL